MASDAAPSEISCTPSRIPSAETADTGQFAKMMTPTAVEAAPDNSTSQKNLRSSSENAE